MEELSRDMDNSDLHLGRSEPGLEEERPQEEKRGQNEDERLHDDADGADDDHTSDLEGLLKLPLDHDEIDPESSKITFCQYVIRV